MSARGLIWGVVFALAAWAVIAGVVLLIRGLT